MLYHDMGNYTIKPAATNGLSLLLNDHPAEPPAGLAYPLAKNGVMDQTTQHIVDEDQ
jgi:hypothetical protein